MADRTGTLWENDGAYASCNHGFASHICHVLLRDVVGIAEIDLSSKTVRVAFQDFPNLERAAGTHPVPGGTVALSWEKNNGVFSYTIDLPQDWNAVVDQ